MFWSKKITFTIFQTYSHNFRKRLEQNWNVTKVLISIETKSFCCNYKQEPLFYQ